MIEVSRQNRSDMVNKFQSVLYEETKAFQPRFLLIKLVMRMIPRYTGARIRTQILRAAGISIGHASVIMGPPHFHGNGNLVNRLQIGTHTTLNTDCFFDLNAPITLGNHVALGHEVMLLTTSHAIGSHIHRAGDTTIAPITIEDGAWIGARSTILPGVTVGAGSVVGAGAVVTNDVPPNTLVGGIPAKVIRSLND